MGVELLFFDGMLANQGDFTVDLKSWPSVFNGRILISY